MLVSQYVVSQSAHRGLQINFLSIHVDTNIELRFYSYLDVAGFAYSITILCIATLQQQHIMSLCKINIWWDQE